MKVDYVYYYCIYIIIYHSMRITFLFSVWSYMVSTNIFFSRYVEMDGMIPACLRRAAYWVDGEPRWDIVPCLKKLGIDDYEYYVRKCNEVNRDYISLSHLILITILHGFSTPLRAAIIIGAFKREPLFCIRCFFDALWSRIKNSWKVRHYTI